MVAAVLQSHLHVGRGIARENTALERFLDAGFRRIDIFLGYAAAGDVVDEFESAARSQRRHLDLDVPVLTVAAGLF